MEDSCSIVLEHMGLIDYFQWVHITVYKYIRVVTGESSQNPSLLFIEQLLTIAAPSLHGYRTPLRQTVQFDTPKAAMATKEA